MCSSDLCLRSSSAQALQFFSRELRLPSLPLCLRINLPRTRLADVALLHLFSCFLVCVRVCSPDVCLMMCVCACVCAPAAVCMCRSLRDLWDPSSSCTWTTLRQARRCTSSMTTFRGDIRGAHHDRPLRPLSPRTPVAKWAGVRLSEGPVDNVMASVQSGAAVRSVRCSPVTSPTLL